MKTFLLTFISIVHLAVSQNECLPTRCGPTGPVIRFPFRLRDHQPEHCGYPGFELSCTGSGSTEFDLQFPVTASTNKIMIPLRTIVSVSDIDYKAQKILASKALARSCLPEKLTMLKNSSSASLFEVEALGYTQGYTLFNCSDTRGYGQDITCLSSRSYRVIAFASIYDITTLPPYSSCFKMYNVSYVPDELFTGRNDDYGTRFYLGWSKPYCGNCEGEGKYCRLKNGGRDEETECISLEQPQHGTGGSRKALIAGITSSGTILMMLIMFASYFILKSIIRKKKIHEMTEKVIENHKGMRPRRYSYADIKRSTNNHNEKLGQLLHKGMLVDQTPIAVKMLKWSEQSIEDFISEVERLGRMQNPNILQLIGYCADGEKRALVYEFLPNGTSLEKLLSSEKQGHTLGWEKLHQITLGIAKGIDYVHQECTEEILNLDINPQNVLLDHSFNPKVLVSSISANQGAIEYIAPEIFSSTFDIVSQKAEAYSFGRMLLDIGGRRKRSEVHFPEWIHNQLEKRQERAIEIEEEGNGIVKKLTGVGLWCIQWFPSDRPSMKSVIRMLEGDDIPALPPNPFASL